MSIFSTSQSDRRFARTLATGRFPLDIPTNDADKSTTHPDVLFVPEGWRGWRYWMVHTPYPGPEREGPTIVVSQNGVDWEMPSGISNPIFSQADAVALGYTYNSDACLVLTADDKLRCYWRMADTTTSAERDAIAYMESNDGRTWGDETIVLTGDWGSSSDPPLLSPSVLLEDDDTYTMWYVDRSAGSPGVLKLRTSADGVTWGDATSCTVPSGVSLWHLDVVLVDDVYYMLLASAGQRLHFWTSADGATWTGHTQPDLDLIQDGFDDLGHYRSAIIPVQGQASDAPLSWDVWLTGQADDGAGGEIHRVALLRNVRLPAAEWVGRAKSRDADVHYIVPGVNLHKTSTVVYGANRLRYEPVLVRDGPVLIDELAFEVVTEAAGQTARVGIYTADIDWQPVDLVWGSGEIDITSTGRKTASIASGSGVQLWPGRYLKVFIQGGGSKVVVLRSWHGGNELMGVSGNVGASSLVRSISDFTTYGALPDAGETWADQDTSADGFAHVVLCRAKTS